MLAALVKSSNKLSSMVSGQIWSRSSLPPLVLSCAARANRILRICKGAKSKFVIMVEVSGELFVDWKC